jgi:hypothetical protein
MSATRKLFQYKCKGGHLTEKSSPLGTRHDDNDETACLTCLKADILETAYLIYVSFLNAKP